MFSFILLENKEETECFFNTSVTFPDAMRQTMPRLSLDINGSKQLNAGPWCFNYFLFRACASKKLKKHNFPVRIMFCRLPQCFYLKLCDLYLQKSSVHPSAFSSIHLQSVCQGQSPVEAAELHARALAQHRVSQSRLQDHFQLGSRCLERIETSWHLWETSSSVWQSSRWKFRPIFRCNVLHFSVCAHFLLPFLCAPHLNTLSQGIYTQL